MLKFLIAAFIFKRKRFYEEDLLQMTHDLVDCLDKTIELKKDEEFQVLFLYLRQSLLRFQTDCSLQEFKKRNPKSILLKGPLTNSSGVTAPEILQRLSIGKFNKKCHEK